MCTLMRHVIDQSDESTARKDQKLDNVNKLDQWK